MVKCFPSISQYESYEIEIKELITIYLPHPQFK